MAYYVYTIMYMVLRHFHDQRIIFGRPGALLEEIAELANERHLQIPAKDFRSVGGDILDGEYQKIQRAFPHMNLSQGTFPLVDGLGREISRQQVFLFEDDRYAVEFSISDQTMEIKTFRSKKIDGSAAFWLRRFVNTIFENTEIKGIIGRAISDDRFPINNDRRDKKYRKGSRSRLKQLYISVGGVEESPTSDLIAFFSPKYVNEFQNNRDVSLPT
jgi:hypothetical protein